MGGRACAPVGDHVTQAAKGCTALWIAVSSAAIRSMVQRLQGREQSLDDGDSDDDGDNDTGEINSTASPLKGCFGLDDNAGVALMST